MTADTPARRKSRGAFFTPKEICDFMVAWAVRSADDRVLEPSCGDAEFLLSAADRFVSAFERRPGASQLVGFELHRRSADHALERLQEAGYASDISAANFLRARIDNTFDAVVGNPPYVRYQDFSQRDRTKAREIGLRHEVNLTGLTSSWAPFVIRSTEFLKPNGRLGLVLPGELLTVNYAADVRTFLMRRFGEVRLVLFKERVFPNVIEEVVLLLAERQGPTDHLKLFQADDLDELTAHDEWTWTSSPGKGRWLEALLPPNEAAAYSTLTSRVDVMTTLGTWGDPTLGMVTGNNKWFALTAAEAADLGLVEGRDLMRICPPGSKHLKGLAFTTSDWSRLVSLDDARGYLFFPSGDRHSRAARERIEKGEDGGVNNAYKCRVRKHWWRVPTVQVPDLLVTYMNGRAVRLIANEAGYHHLNSVHGLRLNEGLKEVGTELLPLASLNSATLLGAEMVGRAYGGGLLKLEPKEAERLPVPSIDRVRAAGPALRRMKSRVERLVLDGRLDDAVDEVDTVVLGDAAGVSAADLALLRDARSRLYGRRTARHRAAKRASQPRVQGR